VYGKLGAQRTGKGDSVDADTLKKLPIDQEFVKSVLGYRKVSKILDSYIGWKENEQKDADLFGMTMDPEGVDTSKNGILPWLGADGKIHPTFLIESTVTGRLSAINPAAQTFPNSVEFRNLIKAPRGMKLLDADYKGMELRILAMDSGDEALLDVFRNGFDPHAITASKIFGIPMNIPGGSKEEKERYFEAWGKDRSKERKAAKEINFGIPYGMEAPGLADRLGIDVTMAKRWLSEWAEAYPVAYQWLQDRIKVAEKDGCIKYSLGRQCPIPGLYSSDMGERQSAERFAKNYPIQGKAGDCTSMAVARINTRFRGEFRSVWRKRGRVIHEVHDQIISLVSEEYAQAAKVWVAEEMMRPFPMLTNQIPLEVEIEIKDRWGD
jgi:DNA polymerase-1